MSMKLRIIQGVGANGFGQAVTLLIQIASVPIMIHAWGVELYGEWVALSALPAYLALSNIGLTSTAGNSLAMLAEQGNQGRHMQAIYQSTWAMVNLVSFSALAILAAIIFSINIKSTLNFKISGEYDLNYTLIVLLLNVAMTMQTGIFEIAFRVIKKNPFAVFFSNLIRLFEWLGATLAVLLGKHFLAVAMCMSVMRIIGNITYWILLNNSNSPLKIGFSQASFKHIKQLIRPAIASMSFPLGLSLTMQGMILLINSLAGSIGVTIFSLYRTFTRVPIQIATSVNQAFWPEISYLYGNNETRSVRKLVSKMQLICSGFGIAVVLTIYSMGPFLIDLWASTPLQHDNFLLNTLTLAALVHIFWQPFWVAMMATNKHSKFAIWFLIISSISFVFAWFLIDRSGLIGAGYAALLTELLLIISAFFCYRTTFRSEQQGYLKFLIRHRIKPKIFTYLWFKVWAKRLINIKGLWEIILHNNKICFQGAKVGYLSVIGTKDLKGKLSNFQVGNESFIGNHVHLALHDKIIIGNNVVINDGCKLLTASHDINSPDWQQIKAPIVIEDYAWIATNSIILPGVTIGKGAVIGAGAVVTRDIPPYQVAAGNPARIIKERQLKELTHVTVHWLAPFEAWVGIPKNRVASNRYSSAENNENGELAK